jgi:toxin ParE1/3/4
VRVNWLRTALQNLDQEAEYIARDSPVGAEKVVSAIIQSVSQLTRYPSLGRPGRVVGTRELVVRGTPYIIPYRVRGSAVEILRVFHGARKWPEKF